MRELKKFQKQGRPKPSQGRDTTNEHPFLIHSRTPLIPTDFITEVPDEWIEMYLSK